MFNRKKSSNRLVLWIALVALMVVSACAFVACGSKAHEHTYHFGGFDWDGFTAQAKYVCAGDAEHIAYYDADITSIVTSMPSCEQTGTRVYTAVYDGHEDSKEETIDALGHDYVAEAIPATYTEVGYTTHTCSVCGKKYVDNQTPILASEGFALSEKAERYSLTEAFATYPRTFEAYLECDADVKSSHKGCTIIGNYFDEYLPGISFRLYRDDGKPSLCLRYDRNHQDSFFFPKSVLGQGKVHIAVTIDGKYVYGYLNGEQVLKKAHRGYLPKLSSTVPFSVGGDIREDNSWWFRDGKIYTLNVFDEYRTADKIKADMEEIDLNDATLLASFDFNESYMDKSVNHNHLYSYYFNKDFISSEEYDYTFAVLGDIQRLTRSYPETIDPMFQWVVDNKDALKIVRVIGLGDITNNCTEEEWTLAYNATHKFDGVIPYSVIRGNHDVWEREEEWKAIGGEEAEQTERFSEYFDDEYYAKQYTGKYDNDIKNTYYLTTICGIKYLFINLDFGPSDDVLHWAGELCEEYKDYTVVISTHCFLYRDATTLDTTDLFAPTNEGLENDGELIWQKLVSKHSNISLVICGHDPTNNIVSRKYIGDHGNEVTCLLVDQQYIDEYIGPSGMVTLFHFSEGGTKLTIETYSTTKNKFYKLNNQMTIENIHVVE